MAVRASFFLVLHRFDNTFGIFWPKVQKGIFDLLLQGEHGFNKQEERAMRILTSNVQDTFRVKAYAGTNGVLLAFDLDEARKPGFLGFAIEQKENRKPWQWLLNSLTFPGKSHTIPSGAPRPATSPRSRSSAGPTTASNPARRAGTACIWPTPDKPTLGEIAGNRGHDRRRQAQGSPCQLQSRGGSQPVLRDENSPSWTSC